LTSNSLRVGELNSNATITTNGTGDLILNTNAGSNSGSITVQDGTGGNIVVLSRDNIILNIENSANKGVSISEADIGDPGDPLLVPSIQPAGSGDTLLVFASSELNLGGGGVILEATTGDVEIVGANIILDGDLDLLVGTISTSTEDSDITITPNGTGVIVLDGEVTINADITEDPADDTTVAAYLKVTSNAGVYYLPMYQ
jgi:hypothetical protein